MHPTIQLIQSHSHLVDLLQHRPLRRHRFHLTHRAKVNRRMHSNSMHSNKLRQTSSAFQAEQIQQKLAARCEPPPEELNKINFVHTHLENISLYQHFKEIETSIFSLFRYRQHKQKKKKSRKNRINKCK